MLKRKNLQLKSLRLANNTRSNFRCEKSSQEWGKCCMKKLIRIILMILIAVGLFFGVQQLLMPKYKSEILEGSMIAEYYQEDVKDHDVMFISDCEVYENFSPITLWEDYGITSYIRGSAQQLIWQSYYLLEDTLKYEKPKIFVFDVLGMQYGEPQSESYNRMSLDGMRWSSVKINAIKASMLPDEQMITYLFPLLRYHSRWNELTMEDLKYIFVRDTRTFNGYLMQAGVKPVTNVPSGRVLSDYQFDDICYEYLDKMIALCKENDIIPVLVKAPSLYPYWYEEWDKQMTDYANENQLLYINFLDVAEETGIDYTTDTYDMGLHLNVYGAEKLSAYFGKILQDTYGLTDHREDSNYQDIWQEKVDAYYAEKARLIALEEAKQ